MLTNTRRRPWLNEQGSRVKFYYEIHVWNTHDLLLVHARDGRTAARQ